MEKLKRYTVTIDLYVYANTDDEAIKEAKKVIDTLEKKDDCKAEILSIFETPFGTIGEARNILWGGQMDFETEKENKGYRRLDLNEMRFRQCNL